MASMVTASCEDGGARAADMAEALQNLPHALMLQPLTKMLQTKMKKASTRYIKRCKQSLPWRSATIIDIKCYNP